MRQPVSFLAVSAFALSLSGGVAVAAPVVPLVAPLSNSAANHTGVELVKKKKSEDSGSDGEKGWWDYLKMALTFTDEDVAQEVQDGRILEHLVGGLLAGLGGHLWMPGVAYKDVEAPPAATTLGIVGTIMAWWWAPFILVFWIPWVGWIFFGIPMLILGITGFVFNVWFIPRALQFAYSDAYGSGGGGGSSKKKAKKKHKSEDDDE